MPVMLEGQTFITDWNTHTRSCWPHNIVTTDSINPITFYPITVYTRVEFVIKITCAYYYIYITTMTTLQLLLSLMLCDFTRKSINSFRSRALLTLGCSPLHHPEFPTLPYAHPSKMCILFYIIICIIRLARTKSIVFATFWFGLFSVFLFFLCHPRW